MFRRIKRLREIVEIQIFAIIVAGGMIIREKYDRSKKS